MSSYIIIYFISGDGLDGCTSHGFPLYPWLSHGWVLILGSASDNYILVDDQGMIAAEERFYDRRSHKKIQEGCFQTDCLSQVVDET